MAAAEPQLQPYLERLCERRDFVRHAEAVLCPRFVAALVAAPPGDPLALEPLLEAEAALDPAQLAERRRRELRPPTPPKMAAEEDPTPSNMAAAEDPAPPKMAAAEGHARPKMTAGPVTRRAAKMAAAKMATAKMAAARPGPAPGAGRGRGRRRRRGRS